MIEKMIHKSILNHGLRLVAKKLPNTESVTILVLVNAGSRYETKDKNGIAHFLEHMFFKGAKRYKDAREVAEAVDAVGGDFNAFTGKEYVGYFIKTAVKHKETAFHVLSDMLLYSRFDPKEAEKERGVILEEYNMYQDTPMYQVGWDFEKLLFGDQPMGWDQVGTKEFILNASQDDFRKYKKDLYTPENIVISIAGNIDRDKISKEAAKFFVFDDGKKAYSYAPLKPNDSKERIHLTHKKTEQAHVVVGFPALPEEHEDHYVEKVLAVILGGNMSSRMFLSVREAKGLAYYISTATDDYSDCGVVSTRAGVDVKRVKQAISAIVEEYKKIRGEKISQQELTKAKDFLKGKLALRLEDSEEYAHLIGKHELLHNKIKTPEEIEEAVDKVEAEDVKRLTSELFDPKKLYCAIIGPYSDKEEFEAYLGQ